ncbi:Rne/Rng family ribonuclease [Bacillus carboniphilus]|uniref:Rne/Rng family ribonuclease n=1 Tax=Bacillus carboniphilus TaxID=86663 RepID=A0ABP3G468_9BACI
MNEIIVNMTTSQQRFALLKNGKLEHFYMEQPNNYLPVGTICVGVVKDVVVGMNAAFIEIGEEKLGFLHKEDLPSYQLSGFPLEQKKSMSISKFLHKGEKVIVQVKKEPIGDKGARLTGLVEWPGTHLIYLPYSQYVAVSKKLDSSLAEKWRETAKQWLDGKEGVLIRTSSAEQPEETVYQELLQLKELSQKHVNQLPFTKAPKVLFEPNRMFKELEAFLQRLEGGIIWVDQMDAYKYFQSNLPPSVEWQVRLYQGTEGIFNHYRLEVEIEKLLSKHVWLSNGASLTIDETEALCSIDVNTGKFIGKSHQQQTVLKTNQLAAVEAARQIRLRDLAGIIVIDFIDLKSEELRESVRRTFIQETKKDHRTIQVGSFHELGLLILTRKRTGDSLRKRLMVPCSVCSGLGQVHSPEALAFTLQRELLEKRDAEVIHIEATSDVMDCFQKGRNPLQTHLEESLKFKLEFRRIEHPHPSYKITRIDV